MSKMSLGSKAFFGIGGIVVSSLIVFVIWYVGWVNFVDQHRLGFSYDKFTGKISKLEHTGWIIATPWRVDIHSIDLRPGQVCMNANSRVLNCKLVQFNPAGLENFIELHGRSAGDDQAVYEILKSYAFNVNEGKDCQFLTVLDDMRKKEISNSSPVEAQKVIK